MASDSAWIILNSALEFVAGLVNLTLQKMGYSEIAIKKLSAIVGWVFAFIFVAFLFWLTIHYS